MQSLKFLFCRPWPSLSIWSLEIYTESASSHPNPNGNTEPTLKPKVLRNHYDGEVSLVNFDTGRDEIFPDPWIGEDGGM